MTWDRPRRLTPRTSKLQVGVEQRPQPRPVAVVHRPPGRGRRRGQLRQFVQHLRYAHAPGVGDQLPHLDPIQTVEVGTDPVVAQVAGTGREEDVGPVGDRCVTLVLREAESDVAFVGAERGVDDRSDPELPAPADQVLTGAGQGQGNGSDVVGVGHPQPRLVARRRPEMQQPATVSRFGPSSRIGRRSLAGGLHASPERSRTDRRPRGAGARTAIRCEPPLRGARVDPTQPSAPAGVVVAVKPSSLFAFMAYVFVKVLPASPWRRRRRASSPWRRSSSDRRRA